MAISDYVRSLRETIGSDFLLLAAVTAITTDDEGRILLVRTADFGNWGTLGGAVDPDESPAEAVVREIREEAGVDAVVVGIRTVLGGPDYRLTYPNGDQVGYVTTVFDTRIPSGVATPDMEEITAVGWFAPSEIAALDLEPLSRQLLIDAGVIDLS